MSALRRRLNSKDSKGSAVDLLVVGLGNPGPDYAGTRHNVGAAVVELLASRAGAKLSKSKARALTAGLLMNDQKVLLAFPLTFMNNSGESVKALFRYYGVDQSERVLVIHDELDLDPGRLRLKRGGGMAGHNGLRSVTQHLGTPDYLRLRIGVGRPVASLAIADYVLSRPSKTELTVLEEAVAAAADAVELFLEVGLDSAMAEVNRRPSSDKST